MKHDAIVKADRTVGGTWMQQADDVNALRTMIELSSYAFWVGEADGTTSQMSPHWTELTGRPVSDVMQQQWRDILHPDDRELVRTARKQSRRSAGPTEIEVRLKGADGGYRWYLARSCPFTGADGLVRWYGTLADIDDRKQAEIALRSSEMRYRSVLEASVESLVLVATDGRIEGLNSAALAALQAESEADIVGGHWSKMWPRESRIEATHAFNSARAGEPARFLTSGRTMRGETRWWDVTMSPVRGADGEIVQLLAASRDMTLHLEIAEQLRQAGSTDDLTSLPNRRAFYEKMAEAIQETDRDGEQLGLLIIDVDHFKHVNDSMGHPAGDFLLKTFSERLRKSVRGEDVVARLAGDEFAVILRGPGGRDDLMNIGRSMLARLQLPISYDGRIINGSASIGGAIYPCDGATVDDLLKCADNALYATKAAGRGDIRIFEPTMLAAAQGRVHRLEHARGAIKDGSILPYYQPKVELRTGRVVGFEALLRWLHPELGLQAPDSIVEAFEDYELAARIGERMQTLVISDIREWLRRGLPVGRVSINAAPAEFLRDDYAENLLDRMARCHVPAQHIEVEVTEHVFLHRVTDYAERALAVLCEAGVTIAMDDFGTGYASLSHLKRFPVDVIKVDQSFVRNVYADRDDAAIVRAVLDLGRALDIETIAEGIETPEQRDFLLVQGCSYGQGYLFGRPMASDDVPALLLRQSAAAPAHRAA